MLVVIPMSAWFSLPSADGGSAKFSWTGGEESSDEVIEQKLIMLLKKILGCDFKLKQSDFHTSPDLCQVKTAVIFVKNKPKYKKGKYHHYCGVLFCFFSIH